MKTKGGNYSLRLHLTLAAATLGLLVTGCQQPQPKPGAMPVTQTGPAALHAVHSQQLQKVMSELSGPAFDRMPQELDQPSNRRESLREVALAAADIEKAALQIPQIAPELTLQPSEREVFGTLAQRLQSEAANLRRQAEQMDFDGVQATRRQMNSTCVACHTLFRDPRAPKLSAP